MDERVYARYMSDLAYFINLLESNPASKYHLPVALAYIKLEKYLECVQVCKQALERFPSHCPTKTLLAEAYMKLGDIISARDLLNDVVAEDDGNYKALKLLGMLMQAEELSDRAIRYFRLAYFRVPEDTSLIDMITNLGGSIDLDDVIEEQSKRLGTKEAEPDEETKTYNEINQSIKNAELMMQDLFNDTSINSTGKVNDTDRLDQLIDETIAKGYDSDKMSQTIPNPEIEPEVDIKSEVNDMAVQDNIDNNIISDDELEKAFATANFINNDIETSIPNTHQLVSLDTTDTATISTEDIAMNDLVSELSNITFDDIEEMTTSTIKNEKDTVVTELADELNNISLEEDDNISDVDIKNIKTPLILQHGEVNLYNIEDNNPTDDFINRIDSLIADTDSEMFNQLDPDLSINKKEMIDLYAKDDEDKFNHQVIDDTELLNNIQTDDIDTDNKPSDKYGKLSLEELLSDDTTFFSTDEHADISDDTEVAPFYQSNIYDEILEKSNLTIDEILSSGPPSKPNNDKVVQIKKLQKKLLKIKEIQDKRINEKLDISKKVKV